MFSGLTYSQNVGKVDYSQKIKEATPKPLPQSPVAKRQTSDAQDIHLKGKVKSVIGERLGVSGVEKPIGRRMASIADFNEQGDYLRKIEFEYRGRPYDIKVHGYIDGARVSTSNGVSFGDGLYLASSKEKKENEENNKNPIRRYKF